MAVLFGKKEGLKLSGVSFDQIYSRKNLLSNNSTDTTELE